MMINSSAVEQMNELIGITQMSILCTGVLLLIPELQFVSNEEVKFSKSLCWSDNVEVLDLRQDYIVCRELHNWKR